MSYSIERYELHNDDEVDYLNIITDGVKYLDKLATSNIALLHLIIYNLMDNFKITTKHICFKLLNDSNEVKKLEITNGFNRYFMGRHLILSYYLFYLCFCRLFTKKLTFL